MKYIAEDILWAKSPRDNEKLGESLDLHSCNVANRCLELYQRMPQLAQLVEEPAIWHRIFWACFLHDFGKLAEGFQRQLKVRGYIWGERHEVLSLAFLDWIAISQESEDFKWVAAAIASHHRDADYIFRTYSVGESFFDEAINDLLADAITPNRLYALAQIMRQRIVELFKNPILASIGVMPIQCVPEQVNYNDFLRKAPNTIKKALLSYRKLFDLDLKKGGHKLTQQSLALRGLVLLSDRLASSWADEVRSVDLPDWPTLYSRIRPGKALEDLRDHQQKAANASGSIIFSAPTGSGKTEAALMWARQQQEQTSTRPNLVYILPYQASMNAMHKRLAVSLFDDPKEDDRKKHVALMHGRSTQVLYQQLLTPASTPKEATFLANRARSMAGLYQPSVWVATPYQLLRGAYRLPGYEMLWAAISGSRLIIDEIHAYDTKYLSH